MKINTNLDAGDVVLTVLFALGVAKFATLGQWAAVVIFILAGFGVVAILHGIVGGFDKTGDRNQTQEK